MIGEFLSFSVVDTAIAYDINGALEKVNMIMRIISSSVGYYCRCSAEPA